MDIIARLMKPVARRFPGQAGLHLMIVGDRLLDHVDPLIGAHMGVVEIDIAGRELGKLQMQLLDPFRFQRRAGQFGMGQGKGEGAQQLLVLAAVETGPVGGKGIGERGLDLGGQRAIVIFHLRKIGYGYAQCLRHRRLVHAMVQAQLAQAWTCEYTIAACHNPYPNLRSRDLQIGKFTFANLVFG